MNAKHIKRLSLMLLLCISISFTMKVDAQETPYKRCLSGSELFIPPTINARALLDLPVSVVAWHGSKTIFENGQAGWDIPLISEMVTLWVVAGRNREGRDYVAYATTHPDTPDTAYIWTIPLDQTTDRHGNQLGNHPICDLYSTSIQNARGVIREH